MAPAVAFPKLSQLAGTEFQVCLTLISSQCTAGVTKLASSRPAMKDSAKSHWQWYHMSNGWGRGGGSAPVGHECAVQKVR